jgi:putative pyridoxal-dependent aspartate 1-decarboxylase
MDQNKTSASATPEALMRIFTIPESDGSTLARIERQISQDLNGFLAEQIVAVEKPLSEIEKDFSHSQIPNEPMFVSDYGEEIMDTLVSHSVHTSSPSFIGHMTSALPYFLLPLSKMMVGLNQNLVKIETSKAFTPLERQVTGMMHNLIYERDESFYDQWMHSAEHALGAFCSGGTVANITALWIARNVCFKPQGEFLGIGEEGLYAALKHYAYEGVAVIVSKRGHYSLSKAADLLGIGRQSFIAIDVDENNKIRTDLLAQECGALKQKNIKVLAIIGIAGTTETGNIDPLDEIADIAEQYNIHFHVDAAWGGATLLSHKSRVLLKGIERADSVTIDAHKQMYVPMGAGLVIFKSPHVCNAIEHHAEYILRKGSKDLGSHTLEGSRPGMAMLVHACLKIIGRQGYSMLIDNSLEKARYFADLIDADDDFELISKPELCLLTYRYVPKQVQLYMSQCSAQKRCAINELLNELTQQMQKEQRESGNSFVSRTRLTPHKYDCQDIIVFRIVLANPLTTHEILHRVLEEQKGLAEHNDGLMRQLMGQIPLD